MGIILRLLHKDGLPVVDDVGGLSGFVNMLATIYEGKDKEEKAERLSWAKSLGWNTKKLQINDAIILTFFVRIK
ncbi:hypothetical protein [Ureibacillus sp. FSL W8-0352]|uniref:hypothetical protein n=1 Tax=Ureibacillus sp. FSL W8-0352 TaxID=2954596 RepID=UPI0030FAC071